MSESVEVKVVADFSQFCVSNQSQPSEVRTLPRLRYIFVFLASLFLVDVIVVQLQYIFVYKWTTTNIHVSARRSDVLRPSRVVKVRWMFTARTLRVDPRLTLQYDRCLRAGLFRPPTRRSIVCRRTLAHANTLLAFAVFVSERFFQRRLLADIERRVCWSSQLNLKCIFREVPATASTFSL